MPPAPCTHLPAGFQVRVEDPRLAQTEAVSKAERCIVDAETLVRLGAAVGMQIRIRRTPTDYALFTVVGEEPQEGCHGIVRMAKAGRERLGTALAFPASIEARGPHPTLSDEEARVGSDFIERLSDAGAPKFLAALAPHGGSIEKHTSEQAQHVGLLLAGRCTSWRCLGWSSGGGAVKKWHITSTDISDRSFPGLASISGRAFRFAVAFHGYSQPAVLVGGGAPKPIREEIRASIQRTLRGTGIETLLGSEGRQYAGSNPRNIVNRLTEGGVGGIQIEQPLEARTRFWREIAQAVVDVLGKK